MGIDWQIYFDDYALAARSLFIYGLLIPKLLVFFNENFFINHLDLSYCGLCDFPGEIKIFKKLKLLKLQGNKIAWWRFPKFLGDLKILEVFWYSLDEEYLDKFKRNRLIKFLKNNNKKLKCRWFRFKEYL